MILKTPPFEDMVRKLRQHIALKQWSDLCDVLKKDKDIDRQLIHSKDGFIIIDTSKYLKEDVYGPYKMELPLTRRGILMKTFVHDFKDNSRIVIRFTYSENLGQVWDLEATRGDDYSIRVPMLREDGCYAGAKGPITPQYESSRKRRTT